MSGATEKFEQCLALMDAFPEQLYVVDPESHDVLWANRALEELVGEPVVGRKCYSVLHGFDEPCTFCNTETLFETGERCEWEHHNEKFNRDLYITDQLIDWPDGRRVRFELAMDVTERKRAEKDALYRMQEFERLFETVPVSLWIEDLSLLKEELAGHFARGSEAIRSEMVSRPEWIGELLDRIRFLELSPYSVTLFGGADVGEILESQHKIFGEQSLPALVEMVCQLVDGGGHFRAQVPATRLDGRPLFIEMSANLPGPDDGWSRVYVSMVDVTAVRDARYELDGTLYELGERVKELRCLHEASVFMGDAGLDYEDILLRLANLIRQSWQVPTQTAVRIKLFRLSAQTSNFEESERRQVAAISRGGNVVGELEVYRLGRLKRGEQAFLPEEQTLLETLARKIEEFSVRKEALENVSAHRERLAAQVKERTKDLQEAKSKLEDELAAAVRREQLIERQSNEILELSTPILSVWEGVLLAPLVGHMDSQRTQHFLDSLLNRVAATEAQVALLDISGVAVIDTQTGVNLMDAVRAIRLLGCQVLLTGIRGKIAQTLVQLGIDLSSIQSFSSLQAGLHAALELLEEDDAESEVV